MNNNLEIAATKRYPAHVFPVAECVHLREAFEAGAEWQKQQSPWISVEDTLPKERTGVFFIVKWGTNRNGYFVGLYNGNGCFESDYWIFLPDSKLGQVTHWMPIVEPK